MVPHNFALCNLLMQVAEFFILNLTAFAGKEIL
jgi:hypothetical protein